MWCKFPLMPCMHQHAYKHERIVGGFFLPNNSRRSVGLNFVFATLHPSFGCHHFLVAYLQTSWFWVCFHEFWDKGLAPVASKRWLHLPSAAHTMGSKSDESWLRICVPVLSPYVDSPMSYMGQVHASPFTEAVLLCPWDFSPVRHC